MKLVYLSTLQTPSPDGIRRTRAVVVRNTMPQLVDTTIASWMQWFKPTEAGTWEISKKNFTLRFSDVEIEVLFRALDTEEDIARVLSLEVTFALVDEFVQIPQKIINALASRCGRYPAPKDGGATNWGMFGSSNPDTEDNWWYDALNAADWWGDSEEDMQIRINERILANRDPGSNWMYFKQPGGLEPNAENLENLPGGRAYYESLLKDHPLAWIQQFVHAEWGYSIAGMPVIASFNPKIHVAASPILYRPALKLVAGLDPGMHSALIFGQCDKYGRLAVLSELVVRDFGAKRLMTDRVKPHLKEKYPNADFIISPDPAANQRSQTDERTVVDEIRKFFQVKVATSNNQLPGRISAIEHFTTRLAEGTPALQIDPSCRHLIRALRAGWRYATVKQSGIEKETPIKNEASHPADAFSYLCQHFYLDDARTAKKKAFGEFPKFSNPYAMR